MYTGSSALIADTSIRNVASANFASNSNAMNASSFAASLVAGLRALLHPEAREQISPLVH